MRSGRPEYARELGTRAWMEYPTDELDVDQGAVVNHDYDVHSYDFAAIENQQSWPADVFEAYSSSFPPTLPPSS